MRYTVDIKFNAPDGFNLYMNAPTADIAAKPYLACRREGKNSWDGEYPRKIEITDASAGRISYDCYFPYIKASVNIKLKNTNSWKLSGALTNISETPVELARFHYFDGIINTGYNFLSASVQGLNGRYFNKGDTFPPVKEYLEKHTWGGWGVNWRRMDDPVHLQPDWATSVDVGAFIKDINGPGWVFGFTGPGTAFGEIGYGLSRDGVIPFYASVMLDGIVLEPNETRALEDIVVWFGDWQEGMSFWADCCICEMGPGRAQNPIVGYCSWYQSEFNIEDRDIKKAMKEYSDWPPAAGGRFIQIDDGFEIMPGDWRPNPRFAGCWDSIAGDIAHSGATPGLWLAPTAVFCQHPIVFQHPECLQHLPDGSPAIAFSNWKWCLDSEINTPDQSGMTYFLDPDNVYSKEFIYNLISDIVKSGWKYLKIDFAYPVSTARVVTDSKKTSFETLRGLFALIRDAAGEDILINSCIGVNGRYALGYADTTRVAGDMGANFETAKKNLNDIFIRTFTHGVWWLNDPDCFHMRKNANPMTDEENWLITGTAGLLGGVFQTSDFPSQWDEKVIKKIEYFWKAGGLLLPQSMKIIYSDGGLVNVFCINHGNGIYRIGVYNFNETGSDIFVPYSQISTSLRKICEVQDVFPPDVRINVNEDGIVCEKIPSHSLRIVTLKIL